jgi:gamma-glutamylcyclotransferase (GGCT)/AIG2-like uncharacterized protein YtfP
VLKVFVYGTLKPGECNYRRYCAGRVANAIESYTWGQLYHLAIGYPAMTPGNNKIIGFLLTFANEKILVSLDELEDYHPQRSRQDNEYQRQKIPVYKLSGEPLGEAWGYLMAPKKVEQFGGILVPSGCWRARDYR